MKSEKKVYLFCIRVPVFPVWLSITILSVFPRTESEMTKKVVLGEIGTYLFGLCV